jgi:hypothetical protein
MEKELVPYAEALELKELGFGKPCFAYYYTLNGKDWKFAEKTEYYRLDDEINIGPKFSLLAPTFSQAFRFFREKHSWQHSIDPTSDQHSFKLGYNYWIWNNKTGEEHHTMPKNKPSGDWEYETYEEAELACLRKLIEIVKEKYT